MDEAIWVVVATLLTVIGNGLVGIGLGLLEVGGELSWSWRGRVSQ